MQAGLLMGAILVQNKNPDTIIFYCQDQTCKNFCLKHQETCFAEISSMLTC